MFEKSRHKFDTLELNTEITVEKTMIHESNRR